MCLEFEKQRATQQYSLDVMVVLLCVLFCVFLCAFLGGGRGGEGCIKIALKQPFVICTGLLNHCPFYIYIFFFL